MLLALKLGMVPALIALVTLVGRRYGPAVAGALSGFPVVSGPIFIFLVHEQGRAFGVHAAIAALCGLLPFLGFALVYGLLCRRWPWWLCMPLGWAAFTGVAVLMRDLNLTLPQAAVLALCTLLALPRLLPATAVAPSPTAMNAGQLLLRMLTAAILVLGVTQTAAYVGPQLSGVFTVFPVATSVLVGFAHAQPDAQSGAPSDTATGGAAAISLLRGMAGGLLSLVSFFFVAACALPQLDLAASIVAALLVAVPLQMLALRAARSASRSVPA